MFREKLKKDLDGISPDKELLSRVSEMMAEEAAKPKQPIYLNVAKWGGMAAAVCLIAVGIFTFADKNGAAAPEVAVADASEMAREMAYSTDSATQDRAVSTAQVTAYSKNERIYFSSETADEIYDIMFAYFTENPHSLIDINLTSEQMDMYTVNGLYICIETLYGGEWLVLIDGNSAFAVNNGEIFSLSEEYRDKIKAYFE